MGEPSSEAEAIAKTSDTKETTIPSESAKPPLTESTKSSGDSVKKSDAESGNSPAVAASNKNGKDSGNKGTSTNDNNTNYVIPVKSEFVLDERSAVWTPLDATLDGDNRSSNDNKNNEKPNKQEKRRKRGGMNKKRPRDSKISDVNKLCLSVIRGHPCSYGDKCKYSHDIKAVLADRPPDISQVPKTKYTLLDGSTAEYACPHYGLYGTCEYSVLCRVGECHLNLATGENLTRSGSVVNEKNQSVEKKKSVLNVLSKDTQIKLRKKTYPFVCKRANENKRKGKSQAPTPAPAPAPTPIVDPIDLSPLPTKRKLIDFRNKVYIAPLTTVGNLPFRRIMKHYGADITCGEMAVATNILDGKPSEWALLKRHPSEDVFGVQIAAGFADQFTRVSEVLEKEIEMDFLDMNLGCPIDIICDKGAGSALMLRDKKLKECLTGMTKVLSCPITIKMRTGWVSIIVFD